MIRKIDFVQNNNTSTIMEWTKEHTIYLLQVLNDLQQQSKHPFHTIWESGTFTFKIFVWTRIILDRGLETSCCFSLWFANTLQMCAKITYYVKHVSLASQLQRECGGAKDASSQALHNSEHLISRNKIFYLSLWRKLNVVDKKFVDKQKYSWWK